MGNTVFFVTGLSGSGKSSCLKHFEDFEIDVVRGLPVEFLDDFLKKISAFPNRIPIACELFNKPLIGQKKLVLETLSKYRADLNIKIIFLDSNTDALILRYKESRRKHPMDINSIENGVAIERKELVPLKDIADTYIDTTRMTPYELKLIIKKMLPSFNKKMKIIFMSFSYKAGVPLEADCVFDVRFLKNPYYEQGLKKFSGKNSDVKEFLLNDETVIKFLEYTKNYLKMMIEILQKEGRDVFYVAFGCTGGFHRSVFIADEIGRIFKESGFEVEIFHKNLQNEGAQ